MRAIAIVIACVLVFSTTRADAEPERVVAIYWQPPGEILAGAAAHAAFVEHMTPMGARLVEITAPPVATGPSLVPLLEKARGEYARAGFAEALLQLDALVRSIETRGGGDLDARQLSDIFFYRWLCRSEQGLADAAWDDLVRAAALDVSRVVDAALLPPRAVSAYRRAIAEVAKLPRTPLHVEVPAGASLWIDGAAVGNVVDLSVGQHLLRIGLSGYEPYSGVLPVTLERDHYAPPLSAYKPPDGDQMIALAGGSPQRVILGALERSPAGWRFVVRELQLPDGKMVSESLTLSSEAPVRPLVGALLARLSGALPGQKPAPVHRRWWILGVVGGSVAVAALAIALGVVYGTMPAASGTVSGPLTGLK